MTTSARARSGTDTTDVLQPYVARMVRYWDEETPGRLHRPVDGTMALVDISGFTRMSERLARHGHVGAEELTEVIDGTFGRLLPAAYAFGANLLKFGGDAQLLLFTGDDHHLRAVGRGRRDAHRAAPDRGIRDECRQRGAADVGGDRTAAPSTSSSSAGRIAS